MNVKEQRGLHLIMQRGFNKCQLGHHHDSSTQDDGLLTLAVKQPKSVNPENNHNPPPTNQRYPIAVADLGKLEECAERHQKLERVLAPKYEHSVKTTIHERF